MFRNIIPRISLSDLVPLFTVTVIGIIVAGFYGIVHDQITFTIGPEYFRNFKFHQFSYADFGFGERIFVSFIGFLATWWVGLISGWILARRTIPDQDRQTAYCQICLGFGVIIGSGFLAATMAYIYGLWRGPDGDFSSWNSALFHYDVQDRWSFIRVAYIHNASYVGGALGLVLTYFIIRPGAASEGDASGSEKRYEESQNRPGNGTPAPSITDC